MSYTKLFSHIITSSIWSEDSDTKVVWVTMLALANKHGEVMASIPGLAKVAGISIEGTQKAIQKFMSPDVFSRTKEAEGRRIEEIDGGWFIINYIKHREMASAEDERIKNVERQRRFRSRHGSNAEVTPRNGDVTPRIDNAEADAEADAEVNTPKPPKGGKRKKAVERISVNDPLAHRIAALFGRRPDTAWQVDEWEKFKSLNPSPEEIDDMEKFFASGDRFLKRSLPVLLNNWMAELDKWYGKQNEQAPYSPNI